MSTTGEKNQNAADSDQILMTTRIIVFALIAGLTTFLAVVMFVIPKPAKVMPEQRLLTYMSIGVLALGGILSAVVPGMVVSKVVGDLAAGKTAALAGVRDRDFQASDRGENRPDPETARALPNHNDHRRRLARRAGFCRLGRLYSRTFLYRSRRRRLVDPRAGVSHPDGRALGELARRSNRADRASLPRRLLRSGKKFVRKPRGRADSIL